jgi:hypothetical protein
MSITNTENTAETTVPAQAPAAGNLQLQDLVGLVHAVQLSASRGAFKAEEMSQIGGLYDRLIAFLKTTGAIAPVPQTQEPADSSEADQQG